MSEGFRRAERGVLLTYRGNNHERAFPQQLADTFDIDPAHEPDVAQSQLICKLL
jgi:hypothetical protein